MLALQLAVYTVFLLTATTQINYDFQWDTNGLLLRVHALSDSKVIVAVPRGYNRLIVCI